MAVRELTYEPTSEALTFVWGGGQYIDVFFRGEGDPAPFTCINVHSMDGEPTVDEHTWQQLCDRWISAMGPGELMKVWENR